MAASKDVMCEVYAARRRRLMKRLGDGVLVMPTAPMPLRNGDVHFPFRPSSSLGYLTGYPEPGARLVVVREGQTVRSVLFVLAKDKQREIWDGRRFGPDAARRQFGVDEAYPIGEFAERMGAILSECEQLHFPLGVWADLEAELLGLCHKRARARARQAGTRHPQIRDPLPELAALRQVKDRHEIAALGRAADATVAGHRVAMAVAAPGMFEYEVQAEMEAVFRRSGSPRNGYESIVASGANACVLHYVTNDRRMRAGDLLLIDAGAEVDGYTADVTRTFPVDGRFSAPQARVYDLVLEALDAGIEAAAPGAPWNAPHAAAVKVLCRGLRRLGLLDETPAKAAKSESYRKFYMHGTSHWLGRDVHDVGVYQDTDGQPVPLRAGMVMTIEPGLYFDPKDRSIPAEYRGIGIRIEDDVLITRGGRRVLTRGVPVERTEIEALCGG